MDSDEAGRKIEMTERNEKIRLAEFFRTEYGRLLSFVSRQVDDMAAQDAEDIIHDVALNLFDRPDFVYPVEYLSAYVYRSVKNRIVDYFRSRRPMTVLEENGTEYAVINTVGMGPDEYVSDSGIRQVEISHDLSRLMDGLNEDEKKLIIDTEVKGRTFSTLSKNWNVPINTLLSRKSRAMAKIRRDMNYNPI
jgi:RNA polymerase sigma factor (sigma-70 family)